MNEYDVYWQHWQGPSVSGYLDEQCPQRGVSLTHHLEGNAGTPCTYCGIATYPRPATATNTTPAPTPDEMVALAIPCACGTCRRGESGIRSESERASVAATIADHAQRHAEFATWLLNRPATEFEPLPPDAETAIRQAAGL